MNGIESAEDYLERILMLSEKNKYVRAIDIAKDMDFSKASVSIALKKLKEKNLIIVEESGSISLTNEGRSIAAAVYERHKIISTIFINLGVSEEQALKDACKVEHDLSEETFNKIKEHYYKNH